MKKMILAAMAVVLLATTSASAAQVRLAGYYDTREQENATLTVASALPQGFGVWGFIDLYTARADSELGIDDQADFVTFYGEGNVNYALSKHWQVMLELNDGSVSTAVLRPGIRYLIPLENGWVNFKLLPYGFDLVDLNPQPATSGQVGIAWRLNFFEDKVFFEGFADLNWRYGEHQDEFYPFITEPQIGFNLTNNFALLVEYRYSALNAVTKEADEGWGIGAEYRF